jgi:indole-3-glycerol phosphate synthase
MDQAKLNELYQYARGLDLEVLLEVHNREELDKALITGARLIGVNNRDLKTFNVSLDVVGKLGPLVKKAGAYLISESGIHQKEDVEKVRMAGTNGILVGESLMKSPNVKQLLESFRLPVNKEIK